MVNWVHPILTLLETVSTVFDIENNSFIYLFSRPQNLYEHLILSICWYFLFTLRAAMWVSLFSLPSPVTTCQPVYGSDCQTSYHLLRVLYKRWALQFYSTVKSKHFVLVFSPWWLAPRRLNLQVFCSVRQSYHYNSDYKIGLTITEHSAAACWPGIPVRKTCPKKVD